MARRRNAVIDAAMIGWLAVVLASYYGFNAAYYSEKLRAFAAFFLRAAP